MSEYSKLKGVNRIIDANINRLKEGLRVSEEIVRFILNHQGLTLEFKKIRHKIDAIIKGFPGLENLIRARKSRDDVGRDIYLNELKRRDARDIFSANIQRVKESLRVLEEFSKLADTNTAIRFKKIRYAIYEVEKKAAKRISSLRHH